MTDPFAKYTEILSLPPGAIIETTGPVEACHTPTKAGWLKDPISTGTRLRVMSTREDGLTALAPGATGYHPVTIFCDQWNRLAPVDAEGAA